MMLGASGNVARNVAALGGEVSLVGVVGDDAEGKEALRLVGEEAGVEGYLVTDSERPTTVKTRFVSGGQQLLRVDLEASRAVAGSVEQRLVRTIRDAAKGAGAILLSDPWARAALHRDAVIAVCPRGAAAESGGRLVVDLKGSFLWPEQAVMGDHAQRCRAGSRGPTLPTETDAQVEAALIRALELWEAKAILVTRASKGISLAVRGEPVRHFPTAAREVFDASGAGDTTLAALGLALAADVAIEDAIAFAQLASGVAVGKVGTATVSPDELVEAALSAHMAPAEAKVATAHRMAEDGSRWRAKGSPDRVQQRLLRSSSTRATWPTCPRRGAWCDRLIVGLNSDESVRALQGRGPPVNDLESLRPGAGGPRFHRDLVVPFEGADADQAHRGRPAGRADQWWLTMRRAKWWWPDLVKAWGRRGAARGYRGGLIPRRRLSPRWRQGGER